MSCTIKKDAHKYYKLLAMQAGVAVLRADHMDLFWNERQSVPSKMEPGKSMWHLGD